MLLKRRELKQALLTVLSNGPQYTKDVYPAVADELGLGPNITSQCRTYNNRGGRTRVDNLFEKEVRWAKQALVKEGKVASVGPGRWALVNQTVPA